MCVCDGGEGGGEGRGEGNVRCMLMASVGPPASPPELLAAPREAEEAPPGWLASALAAAALSFLAWSLSSSAWAACLAASFSGSSPARIASFCCFESRSSASSNLNLDEETRNGKR